MHQYILSYLKQDHAACFCNNRLCNNVMCDLKLSSQASFYSCTGRQMLLGTCSLCCEDLLNVRLRGCWDKGTWARTCWKPHGRFRYVVSNGLYLFVYYGAFGLVCISNRNLKFQFVFHIKSLDFRHLAHTSDLWFVLSRIWSVETHGEVQWEQIFFSPDGMQSLVAILFVDGYLY